MQHHPGEIARDAGAHHTFDEPALSGGKLPTEAPPSGKKILLGIVFYLILLPGVVVWLARLLIE